VNSQLNRFLHENLVFSHFPVVIEGSLAPFEALPVARLSKC